MWDRTLSRLPAIAAAVRNRALLRYCESTGGGQKVDLRGFDPRTSSLLTRRTTDCSTNPYGEFAIIDIETLILGSKDSFLARFKL